MQALTHSEEDRQETDRSSATDMMVRDAGDGGQWQPAARGWAVSRQSGVRAGAALLDAARVPDVATVLLRLITEPRGRMGHALLRARDAVAFCSQRLVGGVRVWQITSGSAATRAATAAAACWC